MPVLSANGETIHYLKEGAGPAVALIHSLGSSVHMWREHDRRAQGPLHGRRLRRARPRRLVGQGRVQRRHRGARSQSRARSPRNFRMSSRRHFDRRAGGADVGRAVAERGQVAGAGGYLCEAGRRQQGACRGDRGSDRLCVDGGVRHAIRGRGAAAIDVADVQDELAGVIAKVNPKVYIQLMRSAVLGDFTALLAAVKVPTLVLIGEQRYHRATAPNPISSFRSIPECDARGRSGGGHLGCLDNPAAFSDAVGQVSRQPTLASLGGAPKKKETTMTWILRTAYSLVAALTAALADAVASCRTAGRIRRGAFPAARPSSS